MKWMLLCLSITQPISSSLIALIAVNLNTSLSRWAQKIKRCLSSGRWIVSNIYLNNYHTWNLCLIRYVVSESQYLSLLAYILLLPSPLSPRISFEWNWMIEMYEKKLWKRRIIMHEWRNINKFKLLSKESYIR